MHDIEEASAFGFRDVLRLAGNVGYLKVRYFSSDPEAASYLAGAMTMLQGTDALILDFRQNEGGSPFMVDQLESYFFDDQVQLTSLLWREGGKMREQQQWTSLVAGPKFLNKPVYVLTSSRTSSAAEQCSYDLQALKWATLVGETTGGAANPTNMPHPLGSHFGAFIPNGEARNPVTNTNWEGVGVVPDIAVPAADALVTAYVQTLQKAKTQVVDSG
jgi:C-terminal processing protease CtpA/Prc